ncbi:PLDc N-terminal domain-containing protein [Specibacter sp. RAF43]|uniref:PLDc N-terminal domain-containing protein n=1 Tax=Specibacter sp. RAF43 TaxID=3233057 RepID=UPI003F99D415
MAAKKRWSEMSSRAKVRIVVAGVVQLALQAAALRDLSRRTPQEVNGPKRAWVAASFLNFGGPIAYFVWGRKRAGNEPRPR